MKTLDQEPNRKSRGFFDRVSDLMVWVACELLVGPIIIGLVILCFMVFDRLHITDTTTQVLVVISPFLLLAFWLWRRGKVR